MLHPLYAKGVPTYDRDWAKLQDTRGKETKICYYNKRTGISQWERPRRAAYRQVLEELHGVAPGLDEYLSAHFVRYDPKGSGEVDEDVFKALLHRSLLGLSEAQQRKLLRKIKPDGHGRVSYSKFIPQAAKMLREVLE